MFVKRRSAANTCTMASGKGLRLWTVSVFFLLMTLTASETLQDDGDYDEWEPCRKWILSGGLVSVKSEIIPKGREDYIPSAEAQERIPSDDDNNYSSEDEEFSKSHSRGPEVRRNVLPQFLRSRHRDVIIPEPRKRSRSCLEKCYNQGYIHPLQCHSLC